MSGRARWWTALTATFLIGLAAGGWAAHAWEPAPTPMRAGPGHAPIQPPHLSGAAAAAQTSEPARIGPKTEIVTRTTYTEGDCSQTLEETETAGADWLGLTRADLSKRYPDAAIESFSADRVVISRQARGCPYRGRTILLRQGRVGVYYGTLNDLGPLERETDITADQLTDKDKAQLENGIVVQTDDEVDRLLEGLKQ